MSVRPATVADVPRIVELVVALAEYEHEADQALASVADFTAALFPESGTPTAFAHVAEAPGADGPEVVGIAIWFLSFSTWTGRNGIWLEDLFVLPEHRGSGLGKALLASLAAVCAERGYPRLEWAVLNWNTPSIEFYESIGALPQDEWTTYRMTGDALRELGG